MKHHNLTLEIKKRAMAVLAGAAFCLSFIAVSHAADPASSKAYWTNFLNDGLSDQSLDVRDSANRPVSGRVQKDSFKQLFILTVFRFADTEFSPGLSRLRRMLADAINPLAQKLRAAAGHIWQCAESFALNLNKQIHRLVRFVPLGAGDSPGGIISRDSGLSISFQTAQSNLPLRC